MLKHCQFVLSDSEMCRAHRAVNSKDDWSLASNQSFIRIPQTNLINLNRFLWEQMQNVSAPHQREPDEMKPATGTAIDAKIIVNPRNSPHQNSTLETLSFLSRHGFAIGDTWQSIQRQGGPRERARTAQGSRGESFSRLSQFLLTAFPGKASWRRFS